MKELLEFLGKNAVRVIVGVGVAVGVATAVATTVWKRLNDKRQNQNNRGWSNMNNINTQTTYGYAWGY